MSRDKRKRWLRIGGGILLVLNGLIAGGYYFYHVVIKRNKKDFLFHSKDLEQNFDIDQSKTSNDGGASRDTEWNGIEWVEQTGYEVWLQMAEDGLKLSGYFIPAKVATNRVVILAHGYSSKGMDMGGFAKYYHEQLGYHVLMPDARGHGNSEGNYIGFGWHERKDYLLWINRVKEYVGKDAKVVLHGISMGAATVMMVSGEELPEQVKAIVEDCGYTSVKDELSYQLKRMYHLPSFPILTFTSGITNVMAGYRFSEASALRQLKRNKLPMLFIHGAEDNFVPTDMVYELYEQCKAPKELLIVPGAGHGLASVVNPEAYYGKLTEFLKLYVM